MPCRVLERLCSTPQRPGFFKDGALGSVDALHRLEAVDCLRYGVPLEYFRALQLALLQPCMMQWLRPLFSFFLVLYVLLISLWGQPQAASEQQQVHVLLRHSMCVVSS